MGGDVGHGAFEQLQQGLLNTFPGDITGDGGVLALARDLVDLVDVDDSALGLIDVQVSFLQQAQQDVLDVFPDVAGLGEGRGIGHREGNIEQLGQGLSEQGFAASSGTDQKDVALVELGRGFVALALAIPLPGQALVVVVDRDGEDLLGLFLSHDLAIEVGLDLLGLGNFGQRWGWLAGFLGGRFALGFLGLAARTGTAMALHQLLVEDLVAEIDALVADVDAWAGDQFAHLILRLPAERALQVGVELGHRAGAVAALSGRASGRCPETSGSVRSSASSAVLKDQTGVVSVTTRSIRPY